MKAIALLFTALATSLCIQSCSESARLAGKVEGSWSGAPERLADNQSGSATVVESFTFMPNEAIKHGGNISISSMVSVTGAIDASQGVEQPFSLSAAASATVSGTWQAIDDDEIAFNIDISTLNVDVDPEAVALSMNMLSSNTSAATDSLKPQVAQHVKNLVTIALQNKYMAFKHIDDVKLKGNTLKYEIADHDYVMSRQE